MALLIKILAIVSLIVCKGVHPATRFRRLSLAEPLPSHYYNQDYTGSYTFGYDVSDPETGNVQYRKEQRYPNGTVVGSYGYLDPYGQVRRYQYIADDDGYRVINNAPTVDDKFQIFNGQKASTESSITWTRPSKSKKKKIQEKPTTVLDVLTNNKYYQLKPPSYYAVD